MPQIGEKPAKDVGYYCATHRVIFSALNYCQLCEKRTISTKELEASFQKAIIKLGEKDDEFSQWHMDEGAVRAVVYDTLATLGITVGE